MKRHILTMKRVAFGLKMSFMLIFAVVTYAAMLKKGKFSSRVFCWLAAVGLLYAPTMVSPSPTFAKPAAKTKVQAAPSGPPKQIYTRSERVMQSQILGAGGKAAYIVSSVGTRSGTLITDVSSGSMAEKVGFAEGDVLLTINQRVVTTASDADRILGEIPSGNIKVSFARQSDSGLQLYNLNYNYAHQPGVGTMSSGVSSAGGGGKGASPSVATQLAAQIPSAESQMVSVVNSDRRKLNAPPVDANGSLASLARGHAQDMAKRHFFNHVNPEGLSPEDRARRAGMKGVFENISYATGVNDLASAAQDAERQMMSEPPNQQNHRSNIIDPNHKTVGIGIAVAKDGTFYMVQEFSDGSP